MTKAKAEVRAEIEAAFRRITILPEDEPRLRVAVDTLSMLHPAGDPDPAATASVRNVSAASTRKELVAIATLAIDLAKKLRSLHRPAIIALADEHVMREPFTTLLENFARGAKRAAQRDGFSLRGNDAGRGQPKDHFGTAVAMIVEYHYVGLTGGRTDLPGESPGLGRLVKDVLLALESDRNPRAALAAADRQRDAQSRS